MKFTCPTVVCRSSMNAESFCGEKKRGTVCDPATIWQLGEPPHGNPYLTTTSLIDGSRAEMQDDSGGKYSVYKDRSDDSCRTECATKQLPPWWFEFTYASGARSSVHIHALVFFARTYHIVCNIRLSTTAAPRARKLVLRDSTMPIMLNGREN
jgi:hypothetical protein